MSGTDELAADGEPAERAGWAWIEPVEAAKVRRYGWVKWVAAAAVGVGVLALGSQLFPGHLVGERGTGNDGPDPTREMVLADYTAVASALRLPSDLAEDSLVAEAFGACAAAWSSYQTVTGETVHEVSGALVDRGWDITDIRDDPVPMVSLSKGRWRLTVFNEMPSGPARFGLVASHRTSSCDEQWEGPLRDMAG
ncbi:hypothetical protein OG730_28730 [Streptomyces sp. NBC_01298]|uniref:hypothetical protein n=1 Tax=Streptomyces sp. NBC_01298 TaxID=2903817 RepID=UPI002E0E11EF|nr:hypothetical protein OG730_28730 [Streptomyces sp. NBC_01298]